MSTTACIKGKIYVFDGINDKPVMHIERYSSDTNAWNVIGEMYDNRFFLFMFIY